MTKRSRVTALAVAIGFIVVLPIAIAGPAQAHGWVTDPPSRQDNCSTGATPFDCGSIKYEPQSVEAPKGSQLCSGGNAEYAVLDDNSLAWPVKQVGNTLTMQWKLTAAHNAASWEYFIDGVLHQSFDAYGAKPAANISHTLTGLPEGKHVVLARWNVVDTPMAFYSCADIQVGEVTNPNPDPDPDPNPDPKPGEQCVPASWAATEIYTGADTVTYAGHEWQAKWWTLGEEPGTTGEWGVWRDLGAC